MDPDEISSRNYINQKINPIFEKLIIDMLIQKPPNPVYKLYKC